VKLKLDANLGTRGRRFLVDAGHELSTAEGQGLSRASGRPGDAEGDRE
jgi:hypothetical protein